MQVRKYRKLFALAAATAVSQISSVRGANTTWIGNGPNDNWTTGTNWSTAAAGGDNLFFDGAIRPTPFNDFAALTSFGGINFNAGAKRHSRWAAMESRWATMSPRSPARLREIPVVGALPGSIINSSPNLQTLAFTSPMQLGMFSHAISGGTGGLALNLVRRHHPRLRRGGGLLRECHHQLADQHQRHHRRLGDRGR